MERASIDRRALLAGGLALAILAVGLRIAAATESFWLDEIWSYDLARSLERPWHALTRLHHDNNHILNTLFVAAVGEREHWIWYRLLSLLTGCGSVLLMAKVGFARGDVEGWTAATLGAVSYPLITVSAQSRGYAPAIFFSLAIWLLLRAWWHERRRRDLLAFWVACGLGLLSHLTFLYGYLALLAWSMLRGADLADRRVAARALLLCHAPPLLAIGALYFGYYRDLVIGGGPSDYDVFGVVRQVLALTVGLPERSRGWTGALAVVSASAVGIAGLVRLWRQPSREWVFYLGVLVVAPFAVLVVANPRLFFPRYLLACIPFFYLLGATLLADLYRRSQAGRVVYTLILAVFVGAQGYQTSRMLLEGTNVYRETIRYLHQHTQGRAIIVGSDHDFRNRKALRFYAARTAGGERIVYRDRGSWSERGPEWYLRHSWEAGGFPNPLIEPFPGRRFRLMKRFDHGPGYGWSWFVYRNEDR